MFVGYWRGLPVSHALTLLVALLDLRVVRQRARREQIELAEKTWSAIVEKRPPHNNETGRILTQGAESNRYEQAAHYPDQASPDASGF